MPPGRPQRCENASNRSNGSINTVQSQDTAAGCGLGYLCLAAF